MHHEANMKSFKLTIRRKESSKGYTLLFAVIVSVLVLSIATFILSVSRKQAILASSARDSIYAFYAADSGLECAIENLSKLATTAPMSSIVCGSSPAVTPTLAGGGDVGTASFSIFTGTGNSSLTNNTQSGAASCAATNVAYVITEATHSGNIFTATSTAVTIETRGYNIGWDGTGSCSITGPRKVERALRYTLTQ